MKPSWILAALAAVAGACLSSGCMTVAPSDKARLAEPCMQFVQANHGRFFIDHLTSTVEQAEGGDGKIGGGCGCR